jgi:hypothetical protein
MEQNTSRDLLLLAAVAFGQRRYESAGSLFAAALASDDAPALLDFLDTERTLDDDGIEGIGTASDAPRSRLSEIAKSLSSAMSDPEFDSNMVSTSADASDDDDDDEDTDPNADEQEDDDDSGDPVSDDVNSSFAGEVVIPSSLSSVRDNAPRQRLVMSVDSPVRLK